ncbi:glycosyltransferase family 39 protein, partial [Candidatus Sumerlaeota bacterium]|nr:glycosyltransferase family 39 protein [Candidatus Sumerlaeota bacterium]
MQENSNCPIAENEQRQNAHIYHLRGFWPAVVFALTLATHCFYIVEMADHPFFNSPLVDSDTYHSQALDILGHGWLGDKVFWQAPLYSYFLALCYYFITVRFFDIRVIQAFLAAISAVLLYEIGRRKVGPSVGIGAAVAAAFYGPLVYYDCEMLAPVLIVLLYLLMALALDNAIARKHVGWWPAAGVFNGLAALAHGLALFIAPLVCLYGLLGRVVRRNRLGKRLLFAGLYAAAAIAPIAPATIRNRIVSKGTEWVLISHNGPINLFIGNHPEYDRVLALRPGLEWASLARELNELGIGTIRESSRYFTRATLANVRKHTAAVARVWLKK